MPQTAAANDSFILNRGVSRSRRRAGNIANPLISGGFCRDRQQTHCIKDSVLLEGIITEAEFEAKKRQLLGI